MLHPLLPQLLAFLFVIFWPIGHWHAGADEGAAEAQLAFPHRYAFRPVQADGDIDEYTIEVETRAYT